MPHGVSYNLLTILHVTKKTLPVKCNSYHLENTHHAQDVSCPPLGCTFSLWTHFYYHLTSPPPSLTPLCTAL